MFESSPTSFCLPLCTFLKTDLNALESPINLGENSRKDDRKSSNISPNKERASIDELQLMSAAMFAVRRKGLDIITITELDWMTMSLYPSFLAPLIWPRLKVSVFQCTSRHFYVTN